MDRLLESNIYKIYPNGALAINTEAEIDCDKLKDVPEAFKIKIWKLSRGMSLSRSQAKKINGLIVLLLLCRPRAGGHHAARAEPPFSEP